MNESISWGVLGAAKIARTSVVPAIHAADHAVVGGIGSRSEEKAAAAASHYPGAQAYSSYDALLADEAIDAIYIPLPNDLHIEWSLRALASGKHVLCEKPMALQAADFDTIRAERDRTGLVAAEAFMVVHHPQWLRVKELLEQGVVGELRHVAGSFAYNNSNALDNIRQKPEHGGGALNDIGVYPVVVTRFVTGLEPITFAARSQWEHGVDTTTHASLGFDGFTTDFYCSMRMAPRQGMVFHGSDGWISVEAPFNAHAYADVVIDIRSRGQQTIERFVPVNQYRRMIEAFGAAVSGKGEFGCSLGFSQANQRVIDALREASLAADDAGSTS